jgi:hypothetical protein
MPKSKAKRGDLIGAMDAFAEGLLDQAERSESLAEKIVAFEKIGRWIAIKHRVSDGEDHEGALLEGLKCKVKAPPSRGRTGSVERFNDPAAARAASLKRWRGDCLAGADGNGGPALDALRAKIPRRLLD